MAGSHTPQTCVNNNRNVTADWHLKMATAISYKTTEVMEGLTTGNYELKSNFGMKPDSIKKFCPRNNNKTIINLYDETVTKAYI